MGEGALARPCGGPKIVAYLGTRISGWALMSGSLRKRGTDAWMSRSKTLLRPLNTTPGAQSPLVRVKSLALCRSSEGGQHGSHFQQAAGEMHLPVAEPGMPERRKPAGGVGNGDHRDGHVQVHTRRPKRNRRLRLRRGQRPAKPRSGVARLGNGLGKIIGDPVQGLTYSFVMILAMSGIGPTGAVTGVPFCGLRRMLRIVAAPSFPSWPGRGCSSVCRC